ncbi:HTH-type transcriptional repressor RspR [Frondihabitans sp. 762G35]|uniref:GntR family transcriptional regulator n=1 Tax=Frondihabitans sp. 762G35 TaxID=1446794 RepID=UPI000D211002|nr:GntR family transcriptional regulator [Frondihabitans sp. 762G35]ARC57966.1 HTH-type transcriptional repressor RspR [Frondihabitans sp. 762G35]
MPVPTRESPAIPTRDLRSDHVFDLLRDDIVRGRLAPGERLHDQELAARLGFSRGTVRTALLRLRHLGLVESVPNRFTRVTPLDLDRYLDTQEVARALYMFAVRSATPKLRDDEIAALRRWATKLGHGRRSVDGEAIFSGAFAGGFLRVFVRAADNVPLERTLDRLTPHLERMSGIHAHLLPVDLVDASFAAVVEAAARRDADAAADEMEAFHDGALAVFRERLAELPEFARA